MSVNDEISGDDIAKCYKLMSENKHLSMREMAALLCSAVSPVVHVDVYHVDPKPEEGAQLPSTIVAYSTYADVSVPIAPLEAQTPCVESAFLRSNLRESVPEEFRYDVVSVIEDSSLNYVEGAVLPGSEPIFMHVTGTNFYAPHELEFIHKVTKVSPDSDQAKKLYMPDIGFAECHIPRNYVKATPEHTLHYSAVAPIRPLFTELPYDYIKTQVADFSQRSNAHNIYVSCLDGGMILPWHFKVKAKLVYYKLALRNTMLKFFFTISDKTMEEFVDFYGLPCCFPSPIPVALFKAFSSGQLAVDKAVLPKANPANSKAVSRCQTPFHSVLHYCSKHTRRTPTSTARFMTELSRFKFRYRTTEACMYNEMKVKLDAMTDVFVDNLKTSFAPEFVRMTSDLLVSIGQDYAITHPQSYDEVFLGYHYLTMKAQPAELYSFVYRAERTMASHPDEVALPAIRSLKDRSTV